MKESDQAATAFITPYGPLCFNTMPFGLKNAGATYQRMIQTCLEKQIGKTVEAYVDDVVVKTRHVDSLINDLRLTFDNLRTYDIKLNPEKCVFGVPAGKLLGFIVSSRGIEANPVKIQALSQLAIPTVRTPIPSHIDLADYTSYHFAASRTVFHGCRLTLARDRLRLLAHVYDSVASIHMTENPG